MITLSFIPEILFTVAGVQVTNTLFTTMVVSILIVLAVLIFSPLKHTNVVSKGIKVLVYKFLLLTDQVTEDRRLSKKILPIALTFFVFIICANLIGLIPGFLGSFYLQEGNTAVPLLRSPNSDLNTTIALALLAVTTIQVVSMTELGIGRYIKRFINFTSPIKFILGFFEMLSEGTRILSFAFRLFGNIFAGEVLLLIVGFLVPYFVPLPFMILEVFIGTIQAFIFAMLALTFAKSAVVEH